MRLLNIRSSWGYRTYVGSLQNMSFHSWLFFFFFLFLLLLLLLLLFSYRCLIHMARARLCTCRPSVFSIFSKSGVGYDNQPRSPRKIRVLYHSPTVSYSRQGPTCPKLQRKDLHVMTLHRFLDVYSGLLLCLQEGYRTVLVVGGRSFFWRVKVSFRPYRTI